MNIKKTTLRLFPKNNALILYLKLSTWSNSFILKRSFTEIFVLPILCSPVNTKMTLRSKSKALIIHQALRTPKLRPTGQIFSSFRQRSSRAKVVTKRLTCGRSVYLPITSLIISLRSLTQRTKALRKTSLNTMSHLTLMSGTTLAPTARSLSRNASTKTLIKGPQSMTFSMIPSSRVRLTEPCHIYCNQYLCGHDFIHHLSLHIFHLY